MTKEEAKLIVEQLRHALSYIEFALEASASLSNRDQASSLTKTLKSASADIIADALAPIFQMYPDIRPESLLLELEGRD